MRAREPRPGELFSALYVTDDGDAADSDAGSVAESQLRSRMGPNENASGSSGRKRRRVRRSSHSAASSAPRPFSPLGSAEERYGVARSHVSDAAPPPEMPPPPPRAPADASEASDASFVRRFAVAPAVLYDEGACVICEDTMSFLHERECAVRSEASGNAQAAASRQRAELLRSLQARSQLAQANQDRHRIVYDLEQTLRGQVLDSWIRHKMLRLRRNLIERDFERFGIRYVAWTDAMLSVHFDPDRGHMPQPEREAAQEHQTLRRAFKILADSMRVPHPQNPDEEVPHLRAIEVMLRTKKQLDESREVQQKLRLQGGTLDDRMRALTAAIARTDHDATSELITTDPETAAGTVSMGGDARTTAANNDAERRAPGSAYATLHVSGW